MKYATLLNCAFLLYWYPNCFAIMPLSFLNDWTIVWKLSHGNWTIFLFRSKPSSFIRLIIELSRHMHAGAYYLHRELVSPLTLWSLPRRWLLWWRLCSEWLPRQHLCDPETFLSSLLCLPGATWACHLAEKSTSDKSYSGKQWSSRWQMPVTGLWYYSQQEANHRLLNFNNVWYVILTTGSIKLHYNDN